MTQTPALRMTTGNFAFSMAGTTVLCAVACSRADMGAGGVLPTARLSADTMVDLNVPIRVPGDTVGTLLLANVATRHGLSADSQTLVLSGSDVHMAFKSHRVTAVR